MLMKKQLKFFLGFYLAFLVIGVSCNSLIDDCGPFPDKFSVVSIEWDAPNVNSTQYQNYAINIRPTATYFFSRRNSFSLIPQSYACSPIPPETDDRLLNIEITTNEDYSPLYTQGTNLIDLFDVDVSYYRTDERETYSLNQFLSSDRKFPDDMILRLNAPPANAASFSFIIKIYIDGTELDYYEFNTDTVQITP